MASYHAIAVTASAIRGLLANACPKDRFPGARFVVLNAEGLAGASPGFGLSVYLHRVAFNTSRRSLPPRQSSEGRRYRPPTPVDLHFLITAWSGNLENGVQKQQALLGWAVRTLQDTPVLPAGLLNSFAGEWGEVFRPHETVELVGEILSYQDLVNIWEVAKNKQQPSWPYVVRMVLIDSEVELTEAGLVQTRVFDLVKPVETAARKEAAVQK